MDPAIFSFGLKIEVHFIIYLPGADQLITTWLTFSSSRCQPMKILTMIRKATCKGSTHISLPIRHMLKHWLFEWLYFRKGMGSGETRNLCTGRSKSTFSRPIDGPWQLGDITAFLKRYRNDGEVSGNPDSKESTGFASTVALTAK